MIGLQPENCQRLNQLRNLLRVAFQPAWSGFWLLQVRVSVVMMVQNWDAGLACGQ